MPHPLRLPSVLGLLLAACTAGAEPRADSAVSRPARAVAAPRDTANPVAPTPLPEPAPHRDSILRPKPPLVATPEPLRGLYVNRWKALGRTSMGQLLDIARRTEINALVIDVKDDRGYMLYDSRV